MSTLGWIALDCCLLAQDLPRGQRSGTAFQRALAEVLQARGMQQVQRAGSLTLWGRPGASGTPHELDVAARKAAGAYVLEAKAGTVSKADLASSS